MISGLGMSASKMVFVGELSTCAQQRIETALGKKPPETMNIITNPRSKREQREDVEGFFITLNLARSICAHCRTYGDLEEAAPLPFRLFAGTRSCLEEIHGRQRIFSHVGFQPRKASAAKTRKASHQPAMSPALA